MAIVTRHRGATPRHLKKAMTAGTKVAWLAAAKVFHTDLRLKRFTHEHAAEAGYYKRKGENLPPGSKAFKRSYTGKKFRRFGHTLPLVFTGESRDRLSKIATLSSTSKGGKAAYASLRKFNFRHPKSRINMAEDFRRLVPSDMSPMAEKFDRVLDGQLLRYGEISKT